MLKILQNKKEVELIDFHSKTMANCLHDEKTLKVSERQLEETYSSK
jgi:hypothetical protein